MNSPNGSWEMVKACHYPNFRAKRATSSSRSDGLNLAVGFQPTVVMRDLFSRRVSDD